MKKNWQKLSFRIRSLLRDVINAFRKLYFSCQGMSIGKGTYLSNIDVTWPHQVVIGKGCNFEKDIFFKFDGIWSPGPSIIIGNDVFLGRAVEFNITKQLVIGNDCLIASGCKFIDHDHGIDPEQLMRIQKSIDVPISIGHNVWMGCNVTVLKGVIIGNNSIIGAGAIVTKAVPANEIWAGIPAKKIGERFISINHNEA